MLYRWKRVPPGGDAGSVGGAGRPVSRTGTWPRRAARGAGKARRLASRCGEAGQGPSISYMEGPCLIRPGRNACAGTGTARRSRRDASGDDPGSRPGTGEAAEWLPNPVVDGGRRVTFQLVVAVMQAGQ